MFAGSNQPFISKKYIGPNITNVIQYANEMQNMANDSVDDCYFIVVLGLQPRIINLHLCSNNSTSSCIDIQSNPYQPNASENGPIWFNMTNGSWKNKIHQLPYWEFELI
jgi:hypothetical protein